MNTGFLSEWVYFQEQQLCYFHCYLPSRWENLCSGQILSRLDHISEGLSAREANRKSPKLSSFVKMAKKTKHEGEPIHIKANRYT